MQTPFFFLFFSNDIFSDFTNTSICDCRVVYDTYCHVLNLWISEPIKKLSVKIELTEYISTLYPCSSLHLSIHPFQRLICWFLNLCFPQITISIEKKPSVASNDHHLMRIQHKRCCRASKSTKELSYLCDAINSIVFEFQCLQRNICSKNIFVLMCTRWYRG